MKKTGLARQIFAEFVGVAFFVAAITGVANNNSTVLGALAAPLVVGLMILVLSDVSGAHLNPAVSLFFYARKDLRLGQFIGFVLGQMAGAVAGAALGATVWNLTAPLTVNTVSHAAGSAEIISEVLATTGLVWLTAKLTRDKQTVLIAPATAAWYFAASVFTSTHAIANPAVAFGRFFSPVAGVSLSISFGLELVVAQFGGTLLALVLMSVLNGKAKTKARTKTTAKATAKK